jgi:hypothetical protein
MPVRPAASRISRLAALSVAALSVAAVTLARDAPVAAAGASFGTPVEIPNSSGLGEPSLAIDSAGRLFVTAPQSLGNVTGFGSPVWTSTTGGTSWNNGVAPIGDPVSGGDTDLAIDAADNVYQTDLWLGDSAMAVSTDHGQSFIANEYGHTTPGDDRPWLAYSKPDNALYMVWDGVTAVYAQKSAPLAAPQLGILPGQTTPVIPESVIASSLTDSAPVRECVCPPGGIAVDQSSGQVYVTYSRQNGSGVGGAVGIARSDNSGLSWTNMSIPGTGSTGSAFDVEWNFIPVKVDSNGVVYAAWGEVTNSGSVVIKYAASSDHGATWTAPKVVSTNSTTSVFPTLDVVSPGVVDVAWYGTSASGDPNTVPSSASWNLDFAQVTGANSTSPTISATTAVSGIHKGCIQAGGGASCSDRSLLDFFQLAVDHSGLADIIFTEGDATAGTNLFFVHQTSGSTTTTTKKPHHTARAAATTSGRGSQRTQYRSIRST